MPAKDCNTWPENIYPDFPNNQHELADDDSDDEDLFQDIIWNNVSVMEPPEEDQHNEHSYILLNQDSNGETQNTANQFYQHHFQVEWIDTDFPLFNHHSIEQLSSNNVNDEANISSNEENSLNEQNKLDDGKSDFEIKAIKSKICFFLEKIDTIKNLMANFKLPDENYPSWAKNIPEDEWKECLKNKLKNV